MYRVNSLLVLPNNSVARHTQIVKLEHHKRMAGVFERASGVSLMVHELTGDQNLESFTKAMLHDEFLLNR